MPSAGLLRAWLFTARAVCAVFTLLQQEVAFTESESIMGGEGGVDGMNELLHHATGTISDFMTNKFPDLLSSLSGTARISASASANVAAPSAS